MEEKREEEAKKTGEKVTQDKSVRNRFWVGILIIIAVVIFAGVVFLFAETDFFISKATDSNILITTVAKLSSRINII